jgi:rhodanese-related sulfurtransferase
MSTTESIVLPKVSARAVFDRRAAGEAIELIDVRTEIEYAEVHAQDARSMPLDRLDAAVVKAIGKPVAVLCKSGGRASKACRLLHDTGLTDAVVVEGGTDAWVAAGLPVVRKAGVISLERQVRIAAGFLVLLGVVLGLTVHIGFLGLSGFVGAGLMVAGITNTCGMALMLARMPWNRH